MRAPVYLFLSFLLPFVAWGQDVERTEIKNESLNFMINFYGQPTRQLTLDKQHGYPVYHYRWHSEVTHPEHPNSDYRLDVWVFPDSLRGSQVINNAWEADLAQTRAAGNELQLENDHALASGPTFKNYIWKDKEGSYFQTYTGMVGNKLYRLALRPRDGGIGGNAGILFVNSFKLINMFPAPNGVEATYTIDFPETPLREKYLMENKQTVVWIETYETPTDLTIEQEPAEYYQATEMQYPLNVQSGVPDLRRYYDTLKNDFIAKSGGTLIDEQPVSTGRHRGIAFRLKDEAGQVLCYRLFLIKTSMYILETKLKAGVGPDVENAERFLSSFASLTP